jgi:surface antigen
VAITVSFITTAAHHFNWRLIAEIRRILRTLIIDSAIIGGKVGRTLDEVDQHLMDENSTHALNELPANTTSTWRNPDSGHRGTFTPINTTQPRPGIYCREFQQTVTIGGETQEAYGTACRQPNGAWEIQQG